MALQIRRTPPNWAISPVGTACAILRSMSGDISAVGRERLQHRIAGWSARLRAAGLDGLAGALLDAAEPFGPLGAQILWVAQPAIGLLIPPDEIDGLANLLDDPAGMAWLRAELTGTDQNGEDE